MHFVKKIIRNKLIIANTVVVRISLVMIIRLKCRLCIKFLSQAENA